MQRDVSVLPGTALAARGDCRCVRPQSASAMRYAVISRRR